MLAALRNVAVQLLAQVGTDNHATAPTSHRPPILANVKLSMTLN
ncbi:hypothetical protein FTUN_3513 [Frigoriglobus tundricola]|uniref:Uncharacterized protein n=1 Tax=Frigoriglobus tundricola TaxID=2774151 RepID=A0A6M5YPG8_9BACT|nr:hypothetical protein FTUN_3513 [Frigoriglobus tundricola]